MNLDAMEPSLVLLKRAGEHSTHGVGAASAVVDARRRHVRDRQRAASAPKPTVAKR
ncbi:hypothetical protein EKL28_18645 [Staphylococcus aureus]|nr:hypothetical protein EKL28_18645 [Staphylococcus aureus]